jgi:hypothetical protein
MGIEQKILVRASALVVRGATCVCAALLLSACGQKGALYMPNDPEFKQRATLPDIVRRQLPGSTATPAAAPASAPTHTSNMTAPAAPANAASAAGR